MHLVETNNHTLRLDPQTGFEAERALRAKNHHWLPSGSLAEPAMSPGWSRGIGDDESDSST